MVRGVDMRVALDHDEVKASIDSGVVRAWV